MGTREWERESPLSSIALLASRKAGRQTGRQARRQAGKKAGRHASRRLGKQVRIQAHTQAHLKCQRAHGSLHATKATTPFITKMLKIALPTMVLERDRMDFKDVTTTDTFMEKSQPFQR